MNENGNLSIFRVGIAAIIGVMLVILLFKGWENVDADEIMVVQSPVAGTLTWYTTPGIKPQMFGKVTKYKKRSIYAFDDEEGKGVEVRFNDGGHGTVFGSIQYDMPLDDEHLTAVHTRFGSQEAVQQQVVERVTGKAIYMSGPLMSSRESYAEKRTSLLHYIEDQIQNGVYQTYQHETRVKDPITDQEKTATVVEIAVDEKGSPKRQEEGVVSQFGIKAFGFTIKRLPYSEEVEAQIKKQQQIAMDVQTAIADAKKAEQRAITVVEQGKATAAEEKWKQEAIKAQAVVEAEQKKAVAITGAEQNRETARLEQEAAGFYKQAQVLRGEGDAAYKQKVMEADGALTQKLEAYKAVQFKWAEEVGKQKWVPEVQMGASSTGGNPAVDLMNLLSVKAARDLSLDLTTAGNKR